MFAKETVEERCEVLIVPHSLRSDPAVEPSSERSGINGGRGERVELFDSFNGALRDVVERGARVFHLAEVSPEVVLCIQDIEVVVADDVVNVFL